MSEQKHLYRTGNFKMKKLSPPKFKGGQYVTFTFHHLFGEKATYSAEQSKVGQIWVVDVGGAMGYDNHTYDIFDDENICLYKHVPEECIRPAENILTREQLEEKYLLAIESSCGEISLAILKDEEELLKETLVNQEESCLWFGEERGGTTDAHTDKLIRNRINAALETVGIKSRCLSAIATTESVSFVGPLSLAASLSRQYRIPLISLSDTVAYVKGEAIKFLFVTPWETKKLFPPKFKFDQKVSYSLYPNTHPDYQELTGSITGVDAGGAQGFDNHTYTIVDLKEFRWDEHVPEEFISPLDTLNK